MAKKSAKSAKSSKSAKKSAKKRAKKTAAASNKKATRKKTPGASKASSSKKKASRKSKSASGGSKFASKKSTKASASRGGSKGKSPAKAKPAGRKRSRKPKTPLTKKQLRHFREILLEKRRDLLGDMTGMETGSVRRSRQDGTGDLSAMPTHPADIGSDNFETEFTLGLLESERVMLAEINEALERIQEGTFGLCLGTGKPIGLARLEARPWAKYCIDYARRVEKGLVRPGDDEDPFADEDEDDDFDEEFDEEESDEDEDDDSDYDDEDED